MRRRGEQQLDSEGVPGKGSSMRTSPQRQENSGGSNNSSRTATPAAGRDGRWETTGRATYDTRAPPPSVCACPSPAPAYPFSPAPPTASPGQPRHTDMTIKTSAGVSAAPLKQLIQLLKTCLWLRPPARAGVRDAAGRKACRAAVGQRIACGTQAHTGC